jgi:hypothetical protein
MSRSPAGAKVAWRAETTGTWPAERDTRTADVERIREHVSVVRGVATAQHPAQHD